MLDPDRIHHVFFDLDRTLWDFETNSELTLKEIFRDLGLASRIGVTDAHFIAEYRRINDIFWGEYRNGLITKEELRHARFEAALKFFGVDAPELAATIGERYIAESPTKTALLPHCKETLTYLKQRYILHIITNGFEEVQHIKLSRSGIDGFFEQVITSEEAGAKKPDPRVFLHALSRSGATSTESIMIGDDLEADVHGSVRAGWQAVFFSPEGAKGQDTGTAEHSTISSLKQLQEML